MTKDILDCDIRLQNVFIKARQLWNQKEPDIFPFIICAYRSPQEQDLDYARGRTVSGRIITYAQGLESPHNYKPAQAFDMGFKYKKNGTWECDWSSELFVRFNEIVQRIDPTIVWGGSFKKIKDMDHWETDSWRKLV